MNVLEEPDSHETWLHAAKEQSGRQVLFADHDNDVAIGASPSTAEIVVRIAAALALVALCVNASVR